MSTENRPRTRQRKSKPAPPLEIPDIEENAAERKRVLNILAQRRYRQRKRQIRQDTTSSSRSDHVSHRIQDSISTGLSSSTDKNAAEFKIDNTISSFQQNDPDQDGQYLLDQGLDMGDMNMLFRAVEMLPVDMGNFMTDPPTSTSGSGGGGDFPTTFDPLSLFFDTLHSSTHNEASLTTQVTPPSLVHSPGSPASSSPSSIMPTSESFPDSYLLPMPELTLLRALLRIAVRLNAHAVWDMAANSPFNTSADLSWTRNLPAAWKPTALQITSPHHPLIDLLPWPAVRDKMLSMLSLPSSSSPSSASSTELNVNNQQPEQEEELPKPAALQERDDGVPPLVGFIYDMEDGAEGIRIWGDDPYEGDNWEVGQVVFQRWWFLFDRPVVERSNYLRRLRGAEVLQCR